MLFTSPEFILAFLPVTWLVFALLARTRNLLAAYWLAAASLAFYAYWNWRFVFVLAGSIAFNYAMGRALSRRPGKGRGLIAFSVGANLLLLGYFKYANFFLQIVAGAANAPSFVLNVVLPLGISFFTFTQITFLVDAYRGLVRDYDAARYVLFVSYFPHLIAGPILHHGQVISQFADAGIFRAKAANVGAGLTIFTIGLAKKLVLADGLGTYVSPVFDAAHLGTTITFFEAWGGALAYTFQLYFDFSGYSDMAIGLSLLFGVTLPINFDSPYKAQNIFAFWRRWHMTLSQFLRDYLYIPLGGNRHGGARRVGAVAVTMLLGGLWHGAAWTYVAWGGLHACFMGVNHAWNATARSLGAGDSGPIGRTASTLLTFLCVVSAWVLFRSPSFHDAQAILTGMAGFNGATLPAKVLSVLPGANRLVEGVANMGMLGNGTIMGVVEQGFLILLAAAICWLFPPTHRMGPRARLVAVALSAGCVVHGVFFSDALQEFIYFQF